MTLPRRASAASTFLLLAALAGAARANPFELFGYTPRAVGMGGSMTALGDDLAGAFYNPAGMLGHTKSEFGMGFADTIQNLHVNRTTSSTIGNADPGGSDPRFELGLIFPLGGQILKDRVALGVAFGHPVGSLVKVQTVDQAHPQFYMYQSKPQRFALSMGIGIKIINGLSIGGGAQVLAQQIGKVNFQLDVASRRFVARDITVDLNTVPTPVAGILIEPNDSIKIGFSWRKESELYYEQPTNLDLGDLGALNLNVHGIAQYWPHVFSLGVAVKPTSRLLVSVQADYLLWHKAPRDQVFVSVSAGGGVIGGLGLSDLLGFQAADAAPNFSDVLVPHLGVEYGVNDVLTLRIGGGVRPAVTPDQSGTTNYLDNFTETISGGLSVRFNDPLKVFTDPVTFDIGASVMIANERTNQKQSADPTGGASYGGQLFTLAAMLRYLY